ncbi:MAG TPA: DinB family protein [Pyrinomonadaceae bacterium]|jgi:uncharacterized damage-inducible protein DinB
MEIVKRTLEPVPGVSREIGFYLSGWEMIRSELREIVSDLSGAELARRITPGAHQIGGLILHIGEAESGWIHAIIAGKELDAEAKKFAHWYDTTETDFAEKGYSARECIERIDKIGEMSRRILAQFADADLEKLFGYERSSGERAEVSLRWVLHHLIDHEANHKGQISMLKRMLRESQNQL